MSLIDAADVAELRGLFVNVRDNRAHTGPFYRAGAAQPETTIRIERTSSYSAPDTESSEERRGDVVGVGAIDLDVQIDDTRVIDGSLYRVRYIHPDRRIMTQLDMEMVAAAWPDYIYLTDEDGAFVTDEYGTPIVGL